MLARLLVKLGILEEIEEFEEPVEQKKSRKRRDAKPPEPQVPPEPEEVGPALVICRGDECVRRAEELVDALHQGRLVLVDLRGVARQPGQQTLDGICKAAFALKGSVTRAAPGVFLAIPDNELVEEWESGAQTRGEGGQP
ncbi:MAG: cell division protein SepF [Synergistales bacterium]|nr:cell division protein SepF [Synergistales bacterium]